MARAALYSKSRRLPGRREPAGATSQAATPPRPPTAFEKVRAFASRFERALLMAGGVFAALAAFGIYAIVGNHPKALTQNDIDAAVAHTLKNLPPEPFHATVATDVIRPSVVLVRRLAKADGPDDKNDDKNTTAPQAKPGSKKADKAAVKKLLPGTDHGIDKDSDKKNPGERDHADKDHAVRGLGTGVVISDEGLVITCLHVVAGAERIGLVFADGTESDAEVVSIQADNDLAVLKAKVLPDDLMPATLRSTKGLKVGDEVIAVGFPFGIGPSTTYGVVSGLRREHEEEKHHLVDLIQFDAAANPGNSGGPLITAEGDVVGIVTSILNPTDSGFFVGIAFAVPIENAATAAGLSPF